MTTFDSFWELYPRKVSKKAAHTAWDKLEPESHELIMEHLEKRVKTDSQWLAGEFIKHPSTWLNQECWFDEYETARTKAFVAEQSPAPVICPTCRSYDTTQRHKDICEDGIGYYDYAVIIGGQRHYRLL